MVGQLCRKLSWELAHPNNENQLNSSPGTIFPALLKVLIRLRATTENPTRRLGGQGELILMYADWRNILGTFGFSKDPCRVSRTSQLDFFPDMGRWDWNLDSNFKEQTMIQEGEVLTSGASSYKELLASRQEPRPSKEPQQFAVKAGNNSNNFQKQSGRGISGPPFKPLSSRFAKERCPIRMSAVRSR